jgi:hypothetical protein
MSSYAILVEITSLAVEAAYIHAAGVCPNPGPFAHSAPEQPRTTTPPGDAAGRPRTDPRLSRLAEVQRPPYHRDILRGGSVDACTGVQVCNCEVVPDTQEPGGVSPSVPLERRVHVQLHDHRWLDLCVLEQDGALITKSA